MNQNEGTKQVLKNTSFLYLRMIIVMLVSLFTSRIVLRTLGFEDFGIYNVVGSVVVFLGFLQAALRNATFRYLTYELGKPEDRHLDELYSMAINSHLILSGILLLVMEVGGVWFINAKLNIASDRLFAANVVYQFSLLTFCLSIIRTPLESNILAHEKMDFYALTSIVEVFLKLLIVYLLVIINFDKLIVYGILTFCIALILSIWYLIFCNRKFSDCRYVKYWDKDTLKLFCNYSGWSLLVNGACMTRSQCINIFFNMFLGVVANAAMGITNQVIAALNNFVANFTQAFRPQLIKSWANNNTEFFFRLIHSTSKISYYLLFIISLPIVVNLDYILKLWLGEYPPMTTVFIEATLIYYLIDAFQEPLVTSVHATGILKYHQIMISSMVFLVIPISYIMLKNGCDGASAFPANVNFRITA